jgi:hypothetical protein
MGELAPGDGAAYAFPAVKQPFINVEDKAVIQKGIDRAANISHRMASGEIRVPRGVYRFKTHEEADEWLDNVIARSEAQKD